MGAGCVGSEPRAARLGKGVRGGGVGNTRVRYRRQLTGKRDRYLGEVVAQLRRSGCLPAGSARKGLPQLRERGAAIPSCSDIRVPELCEGGCPCRSEGSV